MINREDLHQFIGEQVGGASMAWDPRPAGVFVSEEAKAYVEAIIKAVEVYTTTRVLETVNAMSEYYRPKSFDLRDATPEVLLRRLIAITNGPAIQTAEAYGIIGNVLQTDVGLEVVRRLSFRKN